MGGAPNALPDLRLHIWAFVILALAIALVDLWPVFLGLGLMGLGLLALAAWRMGQPLGRRVGIFLKRLFWLQPMALMVAASLGLNIGLSPETWPRILLVWAKISLIGGIGGTLAAGLSPAILGANLSSLGLGVKVSALMWFTTRSVSTFRQILATNYKAMTLRGYRLSTQPTSWRPMGWIVGNALISAMTQAHRLEKALKLRGWRGPLPKVFGPLKRHEAMALMVWGTVLGMIQWM